MSIRKCRRHKICLNSLTQTNIWNSIHTKLEPTGMLQPSRKLQRTTSTCSSGKTHLLVGRITYGWWYVVNGDIHNDGTCLYHTYQSGSVDEIEGEEGEEAEDEEVEDIEDQDVEDTEDEEIGQTADEQVSHAALDLSQQIGASDLRPMVADNDIEEETHSCT